MAIVLGASRGIVALGGRGMAASTLVQIGNAGLLGAALVGGVQMASAPGSPVAAMVSNCAIKGNVSINSGERIYHVPGQDYYAGTVIRPEYGERWFCSEAEARQAGWRKAGR